MNIGFLEALSEDNYDCIVFHDVDLLPENDHLLYRCDETPKHFSVAIDKYAYKLVQTFTNFLIIVTETKNLFFCLVSFFNF